MRDRASGFTLVEILVVVAIFAVLLTIGTLQTSGWLTRKTVEDQTMLIYGELMAVRQSAMNFKRSRSVVVRRDSFRIYSSSVTSVPALTDIKLRYPLLQHAGLVAAAGEKVTFDERGFTTDAIAFCVEPAGDTLELNSAAFDSIVISGLRIRIGKRTVEGAECLGDNNIQLK